MLYRDLLYSAQNIVKKDPGRNRLNSPATAGTNFTKPEAQNKGDHCRESCRRGGVVFPPLCTQHLSRNLQSNIIQEVARVYVYN